MTVNKVGRPSKYSEELGDYICKIVSIAPHGIRKIVKMYSDLPSDSTINEWRHQHPDFAEKYMDARKKQADLLFESALDEIEELEDYVFENPETGAKEINAGIVTMKKAISNQKLRHAAILNSTYRLEKNHEESNDRSEAFNKVRELVNSFNKVNTSEF